jgi:hypothetical protein
MTVPVKRCGHRLEPELRDRWKKNGKRGTGRRLNGDQTHQGRHIRLPSGNPQIQRVRFYR